jgi:hypothetical protein
VGVDGAGAYSLSENGLYTVEGWLAFMRRLTPTGIFTVSRWYKSDSPGETGRMLALAMETLWRLGARDPRAHLILLQQSSVATLLVSPSPFSPADLDRMQKEAVRLGFNMVLTPRRLPAQPLLRALIEQPDSGSLWAFASAQTLDLTPPSDDRPFFFNMLRPRAWLADTSEVDRQDFAFLGNLQATQTLVYATLVSVLLTLMAVVGPLWLRRGELVGGPGRDRAGDAAGGVCVFRADRARLHVRRDRAAVAGGGVPRAPDAGAGGGARGDHPGDGDREPDQRSGAGGAAAGGVVLPAGAGSAGGRGARRARTGDGCIRGRAVATRVLLTVAVIAPPALAMGLCFPLGLRLVRRARGEAPDDITPWLWGVNGACGVCASGLALGTSMAWGIEATLAIGALCYLGAADLHVVAGAAGRAWPAAIGPRWFLPRFQRLYLYSYSSQFCRRRYGLRVCTNHGNGAILRDMARGGSARAMAVDGMFGGG